MTILGALRHRRSQGDAPGEPAAGLAILAYDTLDGREICARLDLLTQAELAALETYERSHANRQEVLDALRSMRMRVEVLSPG